MSEYKWKKQVKEKIGKSIGERTKQEMINKTAAGTIAEDKWERKRYFECGSDTIKNVIKIRLYMWQVNCDWKIRIQHRACAGILKSLQGYI